MELNGALLLGDEEGRTSIVELLKSYAFQPSVYEREQSESARDLFQPGATFAVGFIVNAVALNFLADLPYREIHRGLLTSILLKMAPGFLAGFIKDQLPQDSDKYLKILSEAIAYILERYGLAESKDGRLSITPLGRRCGVHMAGIDKHISILQEAHRRFQGGGE